MRSGIFSINAFIVLNIVSIIPIIAIFYLSFTSKFAYNGLIQKE